MGLVVTVDHLNSLGKSLAVPSDQHVIDMGRHRTHNLHEKLLVTSVPIYGRVSLIVDIHQPVRKGSDILPQRPSNTLKSSAVLFCSDSRESTLQGINHLGIGGFLWERGQDCNSLVLQTCHKQFCLREIVPTFRFGDSLELAQKPLQGQSALTTELLSPLNLRTGPSVETTRSRPALREPRYIPAVTLIQRTKTDRRSARHQTSTS